MVEHVACKAVRTHRRMVARTACDPELCPFPAPLKAELVLNNLTTAQLAIHDELAYCCALLLPPRMGGDGGHVIRRRLLRIRAVRAAARTAAR
eukprot:6724723-Prymnesium_polylepis.1